MGKENTKLADDIADLIARGEFTSHQMSLIEVACRKERARIGPHQRSANEDEGRRHRRLRRLTPEDVSAELATRYGKAQPETMHVDNPTPQNSPKPYTLSGSDIPPIAGPYVEYDNRFYSAYEMRSVLVGKVFVTYAITALSGLQCRVVKINRTRAVIEVEGKPREYTIPLRAIIRIYMNGEFQ